MHWTLLYDVRDGDYLASIAMAEAVGLAVVGVSAALAFEGVSKRLLPANIVEHQGRDVARIVLVLAVLWSSWVGIGSYVDHRRLVRAIDTGLATVLAGSVTDYRPMPAGCHGTEGFSVAGQRFEYADCISNGTFNETGLVHEGQQVRVTHVDGDILRLEVATPD